VCSGKFYRHKSSAHPHTNMAKAALNMMTRTSALDYRESSGIWMNAVDTGWINDENPLPTARRTADKGFQTPLDEVRVCLEMHVWFEMHVCTIFLLLTLSIKRAVFWSLSPSLRLIVHRYSVTL